MGDDNLLAQLLGEGPLAGFILALMAVLGAFGRGFYDWIKGRHVRERTKSKDNRDLAAELKDEVRDAKKEADTERALRLAAQRREQFWWEYAQQVRRHVMQQYDLTPDDLPPWPDPD